MDLRQTQRILVCNFYLMLAMTLLLVVIYECGWAEPSELSFDTQAVFGLQVAMELLTIVVIPVALKMLALKAIRHKLLAGKGSALLAWGTARLNMLCVPMVVNTYLYYQTMSPAFGYMAIILVLCLFFIYPSVGRCYTETEDEEHIDDSHK